MEKITLFYDKQTDYYTLTINNATFIENSENIISHRKKYGDLDFSLDFLKLKKLSKIKVLRNNALEIWIKECTIIYYMAEIRKAVKEIEKAKSKTS